MILPTLSVTLPNMVPIFPTPLLKNPLIAFLTFLAAVGLLLITLAVTRSIRGITDPKRADTANNPRHPTQVTDPSFGDDGDVRTVDEMAGDE